jgi:cell division protein FtsQ
MSFSRTKNRRRADASARKAVAKGLVRRLWRVGVVLGTAGAILGGGVFGARHVYAWVLSTPKLALTSITFSGNKRAAEADLLRLAGLTPGQNLLSIDLPGLEKAMAQHPWVRNVEVRRHFPRGLSVRVFEHEPAAMVSLGDLYVVDVEGDPFKKLHAQDGVDLPLITGVDREAFLSRRDETRARLRAALEMATAYETSPVSHAAPLSEVRLGADGVTLVTGPMAQEVRMGDGGTKEKLARLSKVRTELARRGVRAEVIHLDNRSRPGWVAVKLAIAGSERTGDSPQ